LKTLLAAICSAALFAIAGCGGGSGASISGNYALQGSLSQGGGSFFGGALNGSGGNVTGAFHILDSSNCVDPTTDVSVTGSVGSGALTLNTSVVQAQTFQIKANISPDGGTITNGTYKVTGGCDAGQTGTISGFRVAPFTGNYSGNLTVADVVGNPTSTQFATTANLTQGATADAHGFFSVTGPITINSACFTGFQLASSQIFGTQALFVLTPGGSAPAAGAPTLTLNVNATDATAKSISGSYTATGMPTSACNSNGFVSIAQG
jgi:hypothetical protein